MSIRRMPSSEQFQVMRPTEQATAYHDHLQMRLINFQMVRLVTWEVRVLSPFWRLYCNLDDGAEIYAGRQTIPLRANCVYLVPAWLLWSGSSRPGVRHVYSHFDLPGLTRSLSRAAFPLPLQVYPRKGGEPAGALDLAREFSALGHALRPGALDPFLVSWAKSLIYWGLREAFAELSAGLRERCLQPGAGRHPLTRVLSLIDTHLQQDLSNDVLAEAMHCSRPHLVRLFRSVLGVSPARYVTERRVSHAAELLAYSEESLESIAASCGFANRHHFTRVFSQVIGTPPARYRKQKGPA